jgi:hypothetical protein
MAVIMERHGQPQGRPPWRPLLGLAAGIVLLVALAIFMLWVGTLVTAGR